MIRVVVVSYRNEATFDSLLGSLGEKLRTKAEIVMWTNDEGSRAFLEDWKRRHLSFPLPVFVGGDGTNVGFSKACNRAATFETGSPKADAFFFVNPDARLLTPVEDADVSALLSHHAIVGIRVYDGDAKTPQASSRGFPSFATAITGREGFLTRLWPGNPWSQRYLRPDLFEKNGVARVDWASGSGLFAPRDLWERLGGFDERFFLYVEDVDLGRKAQAAGIPVVHDPRLAIAHSIGGSYAGRRSYRADLHHHRGMWKYYLKWSRGPRLLLAPLVLLGILARFLLRRFA